jgi:hypothetical protein
MRPTQRSAPSARRDQIADPHRPREKHQPKISKSSIGSVHSLFSVIRILDISPVQDILAANEVPDRKDSERQKGKHQKKNRWRHFFVFNPRQRWSVAPALTQSKESTHAQGCSKD